jgi:hypothetical protein
MVYSDRDHTEVHVDIHGLLSIRAHSKMIVSDPTFGFLERKEMPSGHGSLRSRVVQSMASNRVLRGNGIKFVAVKFRIEK